MPKKSSVFLSYRRVSSKDLARYVHSRLTDLGFKVFIDVEELDGRRFASAIRQKIMESDYFLIILKPDTLDETSWVRRELVAALEDGKPIISLIADDFNFSQHVPLELVGLKDYSGIPYSEHYADEAIERIVKAIDASVEKRKSPLLLLAATGAAVVFLLLLVIGLPTLNLGSTATQTTTHTSTLEPGTPLSDEPTYTPSPTDTPTPLQMALEDARAFTGGNRDWEPFLFVFPDDPVRNRMVLVPVGSFRMGSDAGKPTNDLYICNVSLPPTGLTELRSHVLNTNYV